MDSKHNQHCGIRSIYIAVSTRDKRGQLITQINSFSFNACDYRCERCLETEQCAVFRMESEREVRNSALGRETAGIEAALRDAGDVFAETKEMLLEQAEEFDIDLDGLADAGPRPAYTEAKKDSLYQRSYDFTMKTHAFLEKIEPVITTAGKEFFDNIIWHRTVVSAKVFRAVCSGYDPEMRFDAVNSAAVAIKSLIICIMAFDELSVRYPEISGECRGLSDMAAGIKQTLRERFTLDSSDSSR